MRSGILPHLRASHLSWGTSCAVATPAILKMTSPVRWGAQQSSSIYPSQACSALPQFRRPQRKIPAPCARQKAQISHSLRHCAPSPRSDPLRDQSCSRNILRPRAADGISLHSQMPRPQKIAIEKYSLPPVFPLSLARSNDQNRFYSLICNFELETP